MEIPKEIKDNKRSGGENCSAALSGSFSRAKVACSTDCQLPIKMDCIQFITGSVLFPPAIKHPPDNPSDL